MTAPSQGIWIPIDTNAFGLLISDENFAAIGNNNQTYPAQNNFQLQQVEICDGKDNDGDGFIDEDLETEVYYGNILLRSQQEVDEFAPCIGAIEGDLKIKGKDIFDLTPLENLHVVTGHISIETNVEYDLPASFDHIQLFGDITSKPITKAPIFEINKKLEIETSVYPNPTSDFLNIEISQTETPVNIEIYNSIGQKIWQETSRFGAHNFQVSVSDWASGVYVMNIENGVIRETKKLIIE